MTRKKRRAVLIISGLALLSIATALILIALQSRVTFFVSPSDATQTGPSRGTRFRLGGLVASGSYHKLPDATLTFIVTDGSGSVPVSYRGILPDLFREGQGVVAEGKMNPKGVYSSPQ